MAEKTVIEMRIIGHHPTAEDLEEELEDLGDLSERLLKNKRGFTRAAAVNVGDELARLYNTIEDRLVGATSPTYERVRG